MEGQERSDEGSHKIIVSKAFAHRTVLNRIEKLNNIELIKLQVVSKDETNTKAFSVPKTWSVPRMILQLTKGPLALINVTLLLLDKELAEEDILIVLPMLQRLVIDTKSMPEHKRDVIDCID